MLVQWRFKICRGFARQGEEILTGTSVEKFLRMKPRPEGLFLYKPTSRRYDYVDYSGRYSKQDVAPSESTCYLEVLGLIKFVDKVVCDDGTFA